MLATDYPVQELWPWSQPLANCHLVSCRFDPQTAPLPASLPLQMVGASRRRQAEYVAGRHCAGCGLARLTGRYHWPARRTDRAPIWPAGIVGAISHCDGHALALVGTSNRYRGLGVDVEELISDEQANQLAPLVLTLAERQRWAHAPLGWIVSLAFSAKESLFKALYPLLGHPFYFDAAELSDWQADGHASLTLNTTLSLEWRSGHAFTVHHNLLYGRLLTCVAIPAAHSPLRLM